MDFFKIEYLIPLAGIVLVFIGVIKYMRYKYLKRNGISADGIIVDLIEEDSDGIKHFYPVVKFKNNYQFWVTTKADISVNSYSKYKKGDSVSILYDVNNPEKFMINEGKYINGVFVLIVIGFLFLLVGLLSLFLKTDITNPN